MKKVFGHRLAIFLVLLVLMWSKACVAADSLALTSAKEGCQEKTPLDRLVCAVILHDTLCHSSVVKGAILPGQDRLDCTHDADHLVMKAFHREALDAATGDANQSAKVTALYEQWKKNIANLLPYPLEPEYQYRLRRETNEQALLYKAMELSKRSNARDHE